MDKGFIKHYDIVASSLPDEVVFYDFIEIDIFGIPTIIKELRIHLDTFDPASPPLDPGGNPYTVSLTGYIYDAAMFFSYAFVNHYSLLPPYDHEFVGIDLFNILGNPHPQYPNGLKMTPIPFSTPQNHMDFADICV